MLITIFNAKINKSDVTLGFSEVLLVVSLYFNGKWSVWNPGYGLKDSIGISFEHSGFQISPLELCVAYHQNLSSVLNRIICINLEILQLSKITIPFSDYKKLTENEISWLLLDDVIVNDENGIKVGVDKLWKEVENVKNLTQKRSR
uniref:Uncharacterized protein n=1 Tax=Panagrolaimus davidi TaxID=227884 RepID=A0A914QFD1_9BILA